MTTEAPDQSRLRPFRRIAGAIGLVVGGWLVVMIALTFGSAPGKSMAIIGRPAQALAVIAKANGRVLAARDYVTFARSDDPDFVARLYAAGALLVLDAEQAGGCSGLPPKRIAQLQPAKLIHPRRRTESDAVLRTAMTEIGSGASISSRLFLRFRPKYRKQPHAQ